MKYKELVRISYNTLVEVLPNAPTHSLLIAATRIALKILGDQEMRPMPAVQKFTRQ